MAQWWLRMEWAECAQGFPDFSEMSTGWQPANLPLLGGTIWEFQTSTTCLGGLGLFLFVLVLF